MDIKPSINIQGIEIGINYEPVIIAEIGINHNGKLDVAIEMADSAINSGAKIIKHQTHIVEDEMTEEAKNIIPENTDKSIYHIMDECSLNEEDEYKLMNHIVSKKVIFISTPFSRAAVDRLVKFNVPAFKIGSGECNNYPLIEYISKFKKPIIMSTGMNSIKTIQPSVEIIENANVDYALLHCTNIYPTPEHLVRLDSIKTLQETFPNCVVGLSDHTTSNYTSFGAIALGASIIEKHFTDSYKREGPDIECSMDPNSLKEIINGSKILFRARGDNKSMIKEEEMTSEFAFASVVSIEDIRPDEVLSYKNIWLRRPNSGDFGPKDFYNIIGKKALNFIPKNKQISRNDIS